MSNYYDGVNQPLLGNIPPSAKNVLELGCANGRLGEVYKSQNPAVHWTGIEYEIDCIKNAMLKLDQVVWMDLNTPHTKGLNVGSYDTIVIGDVLEHLIDPAQCLRYLYDISTDNAEMVLCIPNMTHFSIYDKMLLGDLTYDPHGLMDNTHLRWMSFSSTYKLLLDSGWIPHLLGVLYSGPGNEREYAIFNGLLTIGENIGIPRATVERNLSSFQLIIGASKLPKINKSKKANLSVIVPMNNPKQFDLNVIRSGGLHEIDAEIIPISGATSAADALEKGKNYITNDWILYCHQDVFVPSGAGWLLSNIINDIPNNEKNNTLIGFAGISGESFSGMVIDRTYKFDYPRADSATSLDEFAILLTKDSLHTIDPAFGWHAWGTDICLSAIKKGLKTKIERVPFFHNSVTPNGATETFNHSIELLQEKHRGYGKLIATTGTFIL